MANNKSVTVLTPHGRRQPIKITLNSTILQVLEEVCEKYNFNPDEYDLKHYNKILDVNLTFRYASIANNACLEMVKCKNPRKVSKVKICVQLEDGSRMTGEFLPSTTIEKMLKDLNVTYALETAVIIYTQREIFGKEFYTLSLKSLGLGNGGALFRLLQRDPEKLKEQAYVYVPPKPKVPKIDDCDSDKPKTMKVVNPIENKSLDPISLIKAEKKKIDESCNVDTREKFESNTDDTVPEQISSTNLSSQAKEEKMSIEIDEQVNAKYEDKEQSVAEGIKQPQLKEEPIVEFLGARNALLFNQAGAKAVPHDEIPDSFFELNMNDAKALLRDVKKLQIKLEDSPLLTTAQRELEREKAKLNCLHKYQQTVIRVQFPHQLVLQAHFKPFETVQTVKDFVKDYLENPATDFTLYTSPPRFDLAAEENLLDLNLVPSAIVYYSGNSDIKSEIKSRLTDPSVASMHAIKTRLTSVRSDNMETDNELDDMQTSTSNPPTVTRMTNIAAETETTFRNSSKPQKSQVPKWLKLSK